MAPPSTAVWPLKPAPSSISLAWSLLASMPMLRAMARTTVGPPPRNSPAAPSSFTMRIYNGKEYGDDKVQAVKEIRMAYDVPVQHPSANALH
eukprot:GHRQ01025991.1.p3 GENE.GHRQ01025991.1~~GHRQ01025991.1.p3  ORF type:complete len:106 (+),score=15.34 GHRQ01025991.1:44-319(+)